jgi:hypothetical protein
VAALVTVPLVFEASFAWTLLAVPFVVDACFGLGKFRRAFSDQGFVKPTYTKEFVFTTSQVDTI